MEGEAVEAAEATAEEAEVEAEAMAVEAAVVVMEEAVVDTAAGRVAEEASNATGAQYL
jgi:hypothetical protein